MELFDSIESRATVKKPLAALARPTTWTEIRGQENNLGPGKPLSRMLEKSELRSMVIWGPPGCGKSSFAKVLLSQHKTHPCFEILATETGVGDIKKIIQELTQRRETGIVIADEFHRFSKSQQDVFLRSVEEGQIILIAMTTENPKYFLNRALLSRVDVVPFTKLKEQDLHEILRKAWARFPKSEGYIESPQSLFLISKITQWAEGDARFAINMLEKYLESFDLSRDATEESILENLQELGSAQSHKSLDKELHYRWISDLIKAMRRGDESLALERLKDLLEYGEDPMFICRRLVIFAAEDVGLASPALQSYIQAIHDGVQSVGLPEGRILISAGILACSRARKSREAYDLLTRP